MAIDHSTSLPLFADVVDDLREFVPAISFIAEVIDLTSSDIVSPEVARGRTLPIDLLAEGLSRRLDVLERFDELISPYRADQEALELVNKAAEEAGTTPAKMLRHTFEQLRRGTAETDGKPPPS